MGERNGKKVSLLKNMHNCRGKTETGKSTKIYLVKYGMGSECSKNQVSFPIQLAKFKIEVGTEQLH